MGVEFRILEPCMRDRDSLEGQGAVRWCPDCRKNVYDFAHLRTDEIARLVAAGKTCAIIDPKPRRRFLRWAAVLAAFPLRFASAQQLRKGMGGVRGSVVGTRLSVGEQTVSVGEAGRFEVLNLAPGVHTLEAEGLRLDVLVVAGKVLDVGELKPGSALSLTGVVVDSTGGAIAGAKLQVGAITAKSDDRGRFAIPKLPEGKRILTVEAPGFRRLQQPFLIGKARIELGELALQLGTIGEVVEVVPEPSPVRR